MSTLLDRVQIATIRRLLALPEPMLRRMAGAPRTYRGADLDPRLQLALRLGEVIKRPTIDVLPPLRARVESRVISRLFDIEPLPLFRVTDQLIAGVPVRIYRPAPGPLPVLLYLHGGGFVVGDLEGYDPICRYFAKGCRVAVVSVDYRLAPEHPFPAAVNDAIAVLEWLRQRADTLELDADRLVIAGDSAGGTLAAVLAQHARHSDGPAPRLQALLYPSTDAHHDTVSCRDLAEGYGLTGSMIAYFRGHYRAPPDDPRTSPLLARQLDGLCPALVVTCGFDPLRDEGDAYARALEAAGVEVSHRCYESLLHGAITMAGCVPEARRMLQALADAVLVATAR